MRTHIKTIALAAALALCCTACGDPPAGTEYRLYTVQTETVSGSVFSTEERVWLDTASEEEAARALTSALLKGSEQSPTLFPEGTRLLSCTLSEEVVTLSLSEEYGQLEGMALTEAEYALTLTLCQIPGVEGVRVLIEGKRIPIAPVGVLTPEQVLTAGAAEEEKGSADGLSP